MRPKISIVYEGSDEEDAHDPANVLISVNEGAYDRQSGSSQLRHKCYDVGRHEELDNESPRHDQTIICIQVSGDAGQ